MAKERFLTVLIPISDTDAESTVYADEAALYAAVPPSAGNKNKVYKLQDGTYRRSWLPPLSSEYEYRAVVDREFPSLGNPLEIYDFTYNATRMGNAPTISAQVKWYAEKDQSGNDVTLEGLWTQRCHVIFNGEKLYLKKIPSSSKSNEDARYKYDLDFVSQRIALENVYIYDVVSPYVYDKPVSESSSFSFYGNIEDLVIRINASLIMSGLSSLTRKYVNYPTGIPDKAVPYLTYEQWSNMLVDPLPLIGVVFDDIAEMVNFRIQVYLPLNGDYNRYLMSYVYENTNGVYDLSGYQCKIGRNEQGETTTSEDKQISFDKNTIHEALQQFHDTFGLQYYITVARDANGFATDNTFIVVGDCEYDFADYEYVLLDAVPDDWDTNYFEYYKIQNGVYVHLTEAETFAVDTYYRKDYIRNEEGIPTTTSPFDYGVNDELLSKDKNNTTDKIVTRITGVGSSENIPWYYPNPSPDGWIKPVFKTQGVERSEVVVGYPLDEGTTTEEANIYEKYLKNRIGNSIRKGRLAEIYYVTDCHSVDSATPPPRPDYLIHTTYLIKTGGILNPRLTLEMSFARPGSACESIRARFNRVMPFPETGIYTYDSSLTYDNPNNFQKMFIHMDGTDIFPIDLEGIFTLEITYTIPHGETPLADVYDYEGYKFSSVILENPNVPEDYYDNYTGITHHYISRLAYVGEDFYSVLGLVPFAIWEESEDVVSDTEVNHYLNPVDAGYSTDGQLTGKVFPLARRKDARYKDVSTDGIYGCLTDEPVSISTGANKDAFVENPPLERYDWLRYYINMKMRLYSNQGWYIGNNKIELADYGLQSPTIPSSTIYTDIFDTIEFQRLKWVTPIPNLMPEVYIKTDGQRRFYNAHNYWDAENETLLVGTADTMIGEVQVEDKVRNPIYKENETDADSEHYQFENEYIQAIPHEHIEDFEDIKPSIKEQRGYLAVDISDAVIADWANQYQNYFTQNEDGTYTNATSTYDPSETYFMLLRLDVVEEFAYDETDNDEIWENTDEGSIEGEYKHPYFFARLRPMGFNIFDLALQDDMVISITTGNCGACNFKIGVDENTKKNPVQLWLYDVYRGSDPSTATKVYDAWTLRRYVDTSDLFYSTPSGYIPVDNGLTLLEDSGQQLDGYPSAVPAYKKYKYSTEDVMSGYVGSMKKDGNVHFEGDVVTTGRFIESQQDTSIYYVWVALMKDTETYGTIMPSARPNYDENQLDVYIRPKSVADVHTSQSTALEEEENADKFVILNIKMPQIYIHRAERELSRELVKYMYENNTQKFNFSIKFSRIFLAENGEVDFNLNENSVLYVLFNNKIYRQYAKNYTYKMSSNESLPEISVDMNEELSVSRTLLQQWDEGRRRDGRSISSRVGTMIRQMQDRVSRTTISRNENTVLSGNIYIRDTNTSLIEMEGGAGADVNSITIGEIDEITSN